MSAAGGRVTFTVRMRFRAEDAARVRETLSALAGPSRAEPGCLCYMPHFVDGEPATVLIYEQYRDEAAVEAHRATEHFKRWAVGGLYQVMLERQVETLVAV